MKAFGYQQFGGPEVFRDIETPDLQIEKDNQVLIETLAVGLNNFERSQRAGTFGGKLPIIPGRDVVGRVVEVGAGVTSVGSGDIVIASAPHAYAPMVRAIEPNVVLKPQNVSVEQAATIVTSGIAAYNAVSEFTHVRRGDHVLVNGATGGVGSIAAQVAKKLGAFVIGTGSSKNKDVLDELNLDAIGLYDQEDIAAKFANQADVVINAALNGNNDQLIGAVIKDGGRAASVGTKVDLSAKPDAVFEHVRPLDSAHNHMALEALAKMLDHDELLVRVFKTLPLTLDGVTQGHRLLETKHAPGRIILINE